jgi:hypothetical protein
MKTVWEITAENEAEFDRILVVLKPVFNIPYTDRSCFSFVIEAKDIKIISAIFEKLKPPINLKVFFR